MKFEGCVGASEMEEEQSISPGKQPGEGKQRVILWQFWGLVGTRDFMPVDFRSHENTQVPLGGPPVLL